jgi:hypothetical protein
MPKWFPFITVDVFIAVAGLLSKTYVVEKSKTFTVS